MAEYETVTIKMPWRWRVEMRLLRFRGRVHTIWELRRLNPVAWRRDIRLSDELQAEALRDLEQLFHLGISDATSYTEGD